ncbi:MAG: YidC/Oxa1 family membrane protein insertase [Armatimonadota bacterium]
MQAIQDILWKTIEFFTQIAGNNYGLGIILLAIAIKAVLYVPTQQQFRAMKDMAAIQPEIKKLQERHKGDPKKLQTEQMELFKRHKINPLGGCLPILIQLPILWGIWSTISKHTAAFDNASFLWINKTTAAAFNFEIPVLKISFIGANLGQADFIMLILYAFSMYLSQKLTVMDKATADKQKMMTIMMPVVFTFILAKFPSALILYWLTFNLLSVIQQMMIMKEPSRVALSIQNGGIIDAPGPEKDKNSGKKEEVKIG